MSSLTKTASETTVLRFYEAMNSTDPHEIDHIADEVLTPDWEDIPLPPGQAPGADGFKGAVAWLHSVFPDFTITQEDLVVDGDRVAVRSTSRGTHSGNFLGVPATQREIAFAAFDFHRLEDGRIAQSWHLEDMLALLRQLGASVS